MTTAMTTDITTTDLVYLGDNDLHDTLTEYIASRYELVI